MKCPLCGADGAYVGLRVVECPNPDCKHHKPIPEAKPVDETVSLGTDDVDWSSVVFWCHVNWPVTTTDSAA